MELDTKYGGGTVLDSGSDNVNIYRYGRKRVFFATTWDKDYHIIETRKIFGDGRQAMNYVEKQALERLKNR